jgi:hypothetical protein
MNRGDAEVAEGPRGMGRVFLNRQDAKDAKYGGGWERGLERISQASLRGDLRGAERLGARNSFRFTGPVNLDGTSLNRGDAEVAEGRRGMQRDAEGCRGMGRVSLNRQDAKDAK